MKSSISSGGELKTMLCKQKRLWDAFIEDANCDGGMKFFIYPQKQYDRSRDP